MLLRNRKTSGSVSESENGPHKRTGTKGFGKGEPLAKRAALSDLSNAIQKVVIDSTKKSVPFDASKSKRGGKIQIGRALHKIEEKLDETAEVAKKEVVNKLSPKDENAMEIEHVVLTFGCEMDPVPNYDFDAENLADPGMVPHYAADIFRYYQWREQQFRVGPYLDHQRTLTKEMRAVLGDWMVDIQENFELNHETLYLAVKLVDMYLDRTMGIKREDLQLIASTAVFIAAKFDERQPPYIEDFLYVVEDAFQRDDLINMEQELLNVVEFDLGSPLSYRYLRRYSKVTKCDMATLTLARYILETSLLFSEFVTVSESLMGAAALLLAFRMKKCGDWDETLYKYSGFKVEDVEPLMWVLNHMIYSRSLWYDKLLTVYSKYSHEVFYNSTSVPLLPDKFGAYDPIEIPESCKFPYVN